MSLPVVSTYRLQLNASCTFDDVRELLPYLSALGVTHLYLSPIAAAAPGSTHNYDVIDPTTINPALGGEAAYARLVETQRRFGIGQVVDVVPNHMGIAPGAGNRAWETVLREGRDSRVARMFDVDWDVDDPQVRGRILLPVLARPLEEVLAAHELAVEQDASGSWLRYFDHRLPLDAASARAWQAAGASRAPGAMRALLERQHYLLGYWRDGHANLNYRRFFLVDGLVGVRVEDPGVFEEFHRLIVRLAGEGAVDGIRVDHPDGLWDPQEYLDRLRERLREAGRADAHVVVEKILARDESLPAEWSTQGTTGYDFMNDVIRVLTSPEGLDRLSAWYTALDGDDSYEVIEEQCRAEILDGPLAVQFRRIALRLHAAAPVEAIAGADRERFVDALFALLIAFPVYRTYHREYALDPQAAQLWSQALTRALAPEGVDGRMLAGIAALMAAPPEGEARRQVMRMQQIIPALQAKGLEDRAFYRYRRYLAANEVGGHPGDAAESVAAFHARLGRQASTHPHRMLSTATHDHKRGEDARARLIAMAGIAEEWVAGVQSALSVLRPLQERLAPRLTGADLALFLQAFVSLYPAGMATATREGEEDVGGRLQAYLLKAIRESAEFTDWHDPDEEYERQWHAFVEAAIEDDASALRAALGVVLPRLAQLGAVASLSQLVLRLAAPGVTDTYQGNELWDLSLVDPDNRRPPDYGLRRQILDDLAPAFEDPARAGEMVRRLRGCWQDGAIKACVIASGLRLRRSLPHVFLDGSYEPLALEGALGDHAIAFARRSGGDVVIALAARLPAGVHAGDAATLWQPDWRDTAVCVSGDLEGEWRDAFTGEVHALAHGGGTLSLQRVLGTLPVALLVNRAPAPRPA